MPRVESKDAELTEELNAYVEELAFGRDDVLRRVEEETFALGGIAIMQTSGAQAALLELLARLMGARRALEVGTFTGYGAIRIARGLAEGGTLLCLELDEKWAEIARANLRLAGLEDTVDVRVGPALDALRAMPEEPAFDFVYLDADKTGYPDYYEELVPRLEPGGLLTIDNVLKGGQVVDPDPDDESTLAVVRLNERVASDDRVESLLLPVSDGLTLARRI